MNRYLRATLATAVLVCILAACAPASDGTAPTTSPTTPQPMASHDTGMSSMPPMPSGSASASAMGSHDMGDMGSQGTTVTIDIANFAFVEDRVEISVGDSVRWVNGDGTRHTITSGANDTADGVFDSGDVAAGDDFTFTFTEAGEFAYFCDIHPTMTGVVVVTP